uniref:Fibrous sheath-interacting protein 2 C-terminal domain-containing protein n=1 Tax=Anolis carolinensis TaxID=28377 RepID=H9GRQ7_ANOCA
MSDRGDHRSHSPAVSAVYSSLFLEEVISQFLIKVFSSLETRYDKETCIGLKEMNALFVNALVDELRRGSVRLFPALEGPPRQERDRGQLYREDFEEICSYMIKEVMRSISKHKIWVSKQDDKCRLHSEKEVQNMVDSVYKNMLEKSGSQQSIQKEVKSRDSALIDTMASFIIQEITKQHLQTFLSQEELPSQSPDPEALSESIVKKVLDTIKKPLVAQAEVFSAKVLEEIMSRVLSKVFQKKEATKGQRKMDLCDEFDFIHMKLLSKVMDDLAKDKSTEVQYLDPVQTNRVVSQTVANSVYNNLLPEFGTTSTVQKCVRAGCSILLERIADFLRSHLKGLSIIILEEVAAKFLSKMVLSLSSEEMDERILESVKDVARKIVGSLQKRIEKNKLQVWQNEEEEDLGSEQSQAVGEVVDSVYMDVMKQSGSEASLYKDLTNKNEDLVNRVACFMVSEISRRDFPAGTVSEDELPRSSTDIKLQSDKIIQKFLDDIEMEKGKKETAGVPGPVVPVAFLEEILSRFLTTIFLEQCDLGIHEKKRLSITEVNEIACLLKTSVEKMISKNNIGLLASSEDEPTLDPQYEEVVNKVVHSVISNVMEKSGSQQELYKDMTTSQVIFPEQVASIIINEISSCNIHISHPINLHAAACQQKMARRVSADTRVIGCPSLIYSDRPSVGDAFFYSLFARQPPAQHSEIRSTFLRYLNIYHTYLRSTAKAIALSWHSSIASSHGNHQLNTQR